MTYQKKLCQKNGTVNRYDPIHVVLLVCKHVCCLFYSLERESPGIDIYDFGGNKVISFDSSFPSETIELVFDYITNGYDAARIRADTDLSL